MEKPSAEMHQTETFKQPYSVVSFDVFAFVDYGCSLFKMYI